MRTLTDAEARTIAVLLGSATAPERERLRLSGLPRSTYHAARRRGYDEGWLRDRYVPEPERFGVPWGTVVVARPFADRTQELARSWAEDPANVLLLSSPNVIVAVFLDRTPRAVSARAARDASEGLASSSMRVVADLRGPGLPVYFDFEGLWSHLAQTEGTVAYPRGLGGSGVGEAEASPNLTDHQRWAAGELAARPFLSKDGARGARLVGPLGLPFSQQRLVAQGWVNHRVFLDPSKLSSYRGNAADEYVFVSGTLRPAARPEQLFELLVRECRVFPFLYAVGQERLLMGAMGATRSQGRLADPGGIPRRPVMQTLQGAIAGIELVREPAQALVVQVDHRYDRVLPRRAVG